ncbi:hypothetical protein KTD28_06115 [Burkholderia gladioli]|uniref:hypothetical protein n=1 Tax=Burkholderia gladioli TaxID=28095 RepID=UPI001641D972|nr:hypothetical protein [Burkholderia gladioli]MBU9154182.1 hypothetical protein [Burkholderia gladioli]
MKSLYARFVLWLILPALQLRAKADEVGQRRFFESTVRRVEGAEWRSFQAVEPYDSLRPVDSTSAVELQRRISRAVRDVIQRERGA